MRFANKSCIVIRSERDGLEYYTFTGNCVLTGRRYSVEVPAMEFEAYCSGLSMEDAFKSVSDFDQEFLQSGITPSFFEGASLLALYPMWLKET